MKLIRFGKTGGEKPGIVANCRVGNRRGLENYQYKNFVPVMESVLETFETKRLMYGSDWPVCLQAASYKETLGIVENFIQKLSNAEQRDILYNTAIKFYNLGTTLRI